MPGNVFIDRHNESLTESLYMLFEDRLGMKVFEPVGMEWYTEGYWKINNLEETARQYLMPDYLPVDGSPPLNAGLKDLTYRYETVYDGRLRRMLTWEQAKQVPFDIILASVPAHVEPFHDLARARGAYFILQVGNEWDFEDYGDINVLASIEPRETSTNAVFYHQEFDLKKFYPTQAQPNGNVYSFINTLEEFPTSWQKFLDLEEATKEKGTTFKSFGGQCRDGAINGRLAVADKMREAMLIYQVKPGGDGFGHVIHNAYAVGRTIIVRPKDYEGQLAERLLTRGTFIDITDVPANLFEMTPTNATAFRITGYMGKPDALKQMGETAYEVFKSVVNFDEDVVRIDKWLQHLK